MNPYPPPSASSPASPAAGHLNPLPRPFSTQVVTAATFLAGALAGTLLLYVSLSRLGRKAEARRALAIGGAVTLAQIVAALVLPYGTGLLVPLGAMVAMNTLSKRLQDDQVVAHFAQGGKPGSRWLVAGTCVGSAVVMLVVIGGGLVAKQALSRHIDISPEHRVMYNKKAGEAEARKVGEILVHRGVFAPGRQAVADYSRYGESVTLELTLGGQWQDPRVLELYTGIAREIAAETGHRFVRVLLLDAAGKTRQKIEISRAASVPK